MNFVRLAIIFGLILIAIIGCGNKSTNPAYNPTIDPADFVATIDN